MIGSIAAYSGLSAANILTLLGTNSSSNTNRQTTSVVSTAPEASSGSDPLNAIRQILAEAQVAKADSSGSTGASSSRAPEESSQLPRDRKHDPYLLQNYTLQEAAEDFYARNAGTIETYGVDATSESDYSIEPKTAALTRGMSAEDAAAFETAFKNRTLKFTSTADYAGLRYSEQSYLIRNASGGIIGNGLSVDPITGQDAIAQTLGTGRFLILSHTGYKDQGEDQGLVVSW